MAGQDGQAPKSCQHGFLTVQGEDPEAQGGAPPAAPHPPPGPARGPREALGTPGGPGANHHGADGSPLS